MCVLQIDYVIEWDKESVGENLLWFYKGCSKSPFIFTFYRDQNNYKKFKFAKEKYMYIHTLSVQA